ncbi:SBBP repeat-containing protein, partial [bacterium]|nr:SBBP repeat-containing protein [bacterium]
DFYTISYDIDGVEGWSARYDGPAHMGDKGNAIAVDDSGNVCVTGQSFRGMKDEHSDYCTVKYNSSGELVWDSRYDARRNGHDVATAIALDLKGNVYITGRSEYSLSKKSDVLHYDYFTIKYNANNGSIAWDDRYDNADVENAQDEATAIAVDLSGDVYVTGRSQGSGTGFDYLTIKYDADGNFQWAKRYNNLATNGHDEATAIAVDSAGNVYVTGRSQGSGTGFDYVTIKYNPQGELDGTWGVGGVARFDGGNGADEGVDLAVDTFGNVYVTGYSSNGTDNDYVTIKYDISGDVVWEARYDNLGRDEAVAIAIFEDAGYVHVYVTGRSMGDGTGFDYATIKYEQ